MKFIWTTSDQTSDFVSASVRATIYVSVLAQNNIAFGSKSRPSLIHSRWLVHSLELPHHTPSISKSNIIIVHHSFKNHSCPIRILILRQKYKEQNIFSKQKSHKYVQVYQKDSLVQIPYRYKMAWYNITPRYELGGFIPGDCQFRWWHVVGSRMSCIPKVVISWYTCVWKCNWQLYVLSNNRTVNTWDDWCNRETNWGTNCYSASSVICVLVQLAMDVMQALSFWVQK